MEREDARSVEDAEEERPRILQMQHLANEDDVPHTETGQDAVRAFPIETQQDWETFYRDHLADIAEEIPAATADDAHCLWRGMNPDDALRLLDGQQERITLRATLPNSSLNWREAVSYTRDADYPFSTAIGFTFNERRMTVAKPTLSVDTPQQAIAAQRDHYTVNGTVMPSDVRYVAIRFFGKEPGKPMQPRVFRVDAHALEDRYRKETPAAA